MGFDESILIRAKSVDICAYEMYCEYVPIFPQTNRRQIHEGIICHPPLLSMGRSTGSTAVSRTRHNRRRSLLEKLSQWSWL